MIEDKTWSSRFSYITRIINTKSELHEIFMDIIKAISEEIVQGGAVGIYLLQEDGTFKGFAGKPEQINGATIGSQVIDPKKDMLVKEMIGSKKTIFIPDTSKDGRLDQNFVESFNMKSLLALPILVEHKLFGLIFLFDHDPPMRLTDLEIKGVEAYVNMGAVAIQNANNLKQKEDLLAQKQLLLGMAGDLTKCGSKEESLNMCFSYLKRIFGSHIVAFSFLLDSMDEKSKSMALGKNGTDAQMIHMEQHFKSIIQEVIRANETIYIPDILEDERVNYENCRYFNIKDLLVIPFVSLGKVLGAVVIANKRGSNSIFYECLIELAQAIVDATAPVYSNLQYLDQLENKVKKQTEELAAANEKVISVIEGITGGFFAVDRDWKFTYINQHQFLPQNKTATEVLGKCIWEIYPEIEGTRFYNELNRVMSERVSSQFEMRGIYGDYWYEAVAYPYEDGICCLFKDITEKKKYEKEFKRLSSLDLIGQMAAGISHEIRNPMATVRGFLQLLKMDNDFGKQDHYYEIMIEELDRANAIITEFLSIGNTKTPDMQRRDLNTIISDMSPLMEVDAATQNKLIEIETEDVPELLLNHNEIRQLLMNLYRNGLEAMDTGKTLRVKTYKEDDWVVLAVRDQGKGINPDVMEKLGTPFFTTKDNGTGLGLGVCYAIAARHNANIEIETGTEGTTFFVKFKMGKKFD